MPPVLMTLLGGSLRRTEIGTGVAGLRTVMRIAFLADESMRRGSGLPEITFVRVSSARPIYPSLIKMTAACLLFPYFLSLENDYESLAI